MNWLRKIISKRERLVVGLMSGTSMDGIDAALVRIRGSGEGTEVRIEEFICREYSDTARRFLLSHDSLDTAAVSDLNFLLGREFADSVFDLLSKAGLRTTEVDLIGTHGQTVFHNPPSHGGVSSTLQLGEADIICEATGITTVGDFRTRDVAAGGEGAPLIPYLDRLLFGRIGRNIIAQNIGGISNCTLVTNNLGELLAFDTGPGNSLVDSVVRFASNGKSNFDKDAAIAKQGSVRKDILHKLMKNPYFDMKPPKSTGKELFGDRMARELFAFVEEGSVSLPDLLRTLVEFTVSSIVLAYDRFIRPRANIEEVVLSGGGARNPVMVSSLREKLSPTRLCLLDEYGIVVEAKEALGFALLANETVCANRANMPEVTGAREATVLGKISIGKNVA
ncbi:MAG: anhydro-N-acetylmuramic acid kinase [Candidatus Dadabacteria bacterium]|nr:anhydro-N-acetylmuramic acid kinase [Candidatus Dadabacteria bacterium]